MNSQGKDANGSGSPPAFGIGGFLGCLVSGLLPGLIYYGAALGLGVWNDPSVGTGSRIAGTFTTYVLYTVVMVMGESRIEDLVKFAFFTLACAVTWSECDPHVQALLLGIPLGAGLPLITRARHTAPPTPLE